MNFRLLVLFGILLLSVVGYAALKGPVSFLSWPVSCTGNKPLWLDEVAGTVKSLGLPGFQLAWRDSEGYDGVCAVGWAGLRGWLDGRLRTDHVMRYASLSKVFTSAVAMQLVSEGRLSVDAYLVEQLQLSGPFKDERIAKVTIGQLLSHTAGFDRAISGDPMMTQKMSRVGGDRFLVNARLDHEPGTYYAYANVGYYLLGLVIERIEGLPLEQVFRRRLIEPAAASMQVLRSGIYLPDEAQHGFALQESSEDLLNFDYGAMIATGAWAGTAEDFLAVLELVFADGSPSVSSEKQGELLQVDPHCPIGQWRKCHGFGFYKYREQGCPAIYWRDGSLPGVSSFAGIFDNGTKVVFLANGRNYDWMPGNDAIGLSLYKVFTRPCSG